ncbi:phage antirepressor KilAC domain-containing protein [Aeromonas jandaei]|nr:phage antirepressor KilAC domain-containing protein [Aeromonas jandaei]
MQLTTVQNKMPMNNFNFAAMAEVNNEIRMSTREIAEMLGCQHSHVKISVERLIKAGAIDGLAVREHEFKIANGNTYIEYMLDQESSITLVAQLDPTFCNAIVKRWRELENKVKNPHWVLDTMNADQAEYVARIAVDRAKFVRIAEQQQQLLIEAEPKIKFHDDFTAKACDKPLDEVAALVDTGRTRLCELLRLHGVFKKCGAKPYQQYIDLGYFRFKFRTLNGERVISSTLVTPDGMKWLHKQIKKWTKTDLTCVGLN